MMCKPVNLARCLSQSECGLGNDWLMCQSGGNSNRVCVDVDGVHAADIFIILSIFLSLVNTYTCRCTRAHVLV